MILFNFDFFDSKLVNDTIEYLKEEYKDELLREGSKWKFNGKGFKNKTALVGYIHEKVFVNKNYFQVKKVTSKNYKINKETINSLYKLFMKETPLYIDREKLYKWMLLSSELMFSSNEKICFTIMFEDPYKQWSAQEIVDNVKKYDFQKELKVNKIEESLNRYLGNNEKKATLVLHQNINGVNMYKIHFTNFVYYLRDFINE